jgi:hypothetical protein
VWTASPLYDVNAVHFTSYQTHYDKPFDVPQDRKVVLTVDVTKLGLDVDTLEYLKRVAGPRFSPVNNRLKIATTQFDNVLQNKRYLLEKLQHLVKESAALKKEFGDKWKTEA